LPSECSGQDASATGAYQQDGAVEGGGGGSSGRRDADADRAPLRPIACPLHCTIARTRRQHTAVGSRPRRVARGVLREPTELGSAHPSWPRAWGRCSAGPCHSASGIARGAGPLGTERALPPSGLGLGSSAGCWRNYAVAAPSFASRASTGCVAASSRSSPVVRPHHPPQVDSETLPHTIAYVCILVESNIRELGGCGRACWSGACLRMCWACWCGIEARVRRTCTSGDGDAPSAASMETAFFSCSAIPGRARALVMPFDSPCEQAVSHHHHLYQRHSHRQR